MPIRYGTPSGISASEVAFSIFADVDTSFFDVKRPEHEWPKFVLASQVKNNINPGATSHAYMTRDTQGTAAFVGNGPTRNIPMVGQSMGAVTLTFAASAIGAEITNEDARQYHFGMSADLASDLGTVMRKGCDNLVDQSVFFGAPSLGWKGVLALDAITIETAAQGASGATEWADKTGLEMVADVNNAIRDVFTATNTIFKTGTLFLPPDAFMLLAGTYCTIDGVLTGKTALDILKESNSYTALTGQSLEIITLRYLAGAGVGGTNRMILMDRDPENQILPFPMAYTLAQPVPTALAAQFFAEQKFGPYHVRQPGSMIYVDGI